MKAMNRMEAIWNCIANGQVCDLEAETREEMWAIAIANKLAGGGSSGGSSGGSGGSSGSGVEFVSLFYNVDWLEYELTGTTYEEIEEKLENGTLVVIKDASNYFYPCQASVGNEDDFTFARPDGKGLLTLKPDSSVTIEYASE